MFIYFLFIFFFCFLLHLIIGRIALPSFLMKCPNLERAPKYILQQHDKKAQQQKSFDIQRPVPMTWSSHKAKLIQLEKNSLQPSFCYFARSTAQYPTAKSALPIYCQQINIDDGFSKILVMAIRIVEFSSGGYKIRQIFA